MDDMNLAKRIGVRCKRIRESKGMTLQELGDLVGTGAANISKMENHGINDIHWITSISKVLGQDLLKDEVDEEGIIGEIGKEILIKLIENEGHLSYQEIVADMYGMSEDRVSNEIFKLTRIGMCIREQYKDFTNKQVDRIFITAKGLITCRNQITNPLIEERILPKIDKVVTYEKLLGEYTEEGKEPPKCYQDCVDSHPLEKMIHNLSITDRLYRIEFIIWLKKKYTHGIEKFRYSEIIDNSFYSFEVFDDRFPSKSFFFDILYRMALGISYEDLLILYGSEYLQEKYHYSKKEVENDEYLQIEKKLGLMPDFDDPEYWKKSSKENLDKLFAEEFGLKSYKTSDGEESFQDPDLYILTEEEREYYLDCSEQINESMELDVIQSLPKKDWFAKMAEKMEAKGIKSKNPVDWFSEEEILAFVKENHWKASTAEEICVEKQLAEIIELCPDVLRYYDIGDLILSDSYCMFDSVRSYIKEIYEL
ncbi:MAG: helix-turn-helix domain-containing protein [Lachnospiraceae bacterium]|nr:helix-turn-helix domain-containing protein [Lachnospiraceae bacterium]